MDLCDRPFTARLVSRTFCGIRRTWSRSESLCTLHRSKPGPIDLLLKIESQILNGITLGFRVDELAMAIAQQKQVGKGVALFVRLSGVEARTTLTIL
jgi:hypothetical protein